jgi:hypothetical protein
MRYLAIIFLSLILSGCVTKYVYIDRMTPVTIPSDFLKAEPIPKKPGGGLWSESDMQGDTLAEFIRDLRTTIDKLNDKLAGTDKLIKQHNETVKQFNESQKRP